MANDEDCPLIHDDHIVQTQAYNTSTEVENEPAEQRSNRSRYFVVLCILFMELCERLTFYGVTANLVFYCKDVLKLATPLSSTITLAFQGKHLVESC